LNLPHIHLLLNHWPIVGTFIALALFVVALTTRKNEIKQVSFVLWALLALVAIPVYLSGNAAADAMKKIETVEMSAPLVEAHEGAALLAFALLELTGVFSLVGLWQYTGPTIEPSKYGGWATAAVLIFGIATAGLMAAAGNTGGDIRHPEIAGDMAAPAGIAATGAKTLLGLRYFVIDYSRWVWPIIETFHFIGLILLLGAVGMLSFRILGFMKQLPLGPLHRLIPLGLLGLVINVITGFLFFVGMPFFYVFNWYFQMKILAIAVAGAILLMFYCTPIFRKWGSIGAGEDAPVLAKVVALTSIVLWVVIVIIGRYIPLGEGG
jgi:uncharacterized membrane protein